MKNFYAIFKGVFATLVATSMLAVSCTEPYDDTQIRQELADLYQKVDNLEKKLSTEVDALKALIDSKAVVASATKSTDGSWEILLTSGEKITVYPQYQPEPQAPEVNNGCVTVVKEGDAYYWAQIVDGKAVAITDAAGNKIPVTHNAAPEVRVNPATGDVELSVDGGHTWVIVEKKAEQSTEAACIFTGVVDGETSVDFTLASGEVISVPKAESIDFGVQAGKTFVTPGESVDVALKAENIDDLTVIAKPEGWKASISGKTLKVTAPAQEKIEAGEAELEGFVKIHAAGGDGKCMVGKLVVSASTASVLIEVVGEDATIYNNTGLRWSGVSYGIAAYDDFSAEAIAAAKNNYELMSYELYETQATVSIKQMYNEMIAQVYDPASYVEIPTGTSYVVWALAGSDAWDHVYSADEVVYTVYTPAFVNVEATNISFNNIEISAVGGGYAGYIVGVLSGDSEAEMLSSLENSFGYWQMGYGIFGAELTELNYKGGILGFGDSYYQVVSPNTNYLVYILPLVEGKSDGEYTMADMKTYLYTTSALEAGGSATLSFEATETTYQNVEVLVTGSDNTTMIYAANMTAEKYAQYKSDEELLEFVWSYCDMYGAAVSGNQAYTMLSGYTPGQTGYVVAVAVDENGKYSQLYKQAFSTKTLAYNENLKVVIDEAASKVDVTTASIKISTTGGEAVSYRYMAVETSGYAWKGEQSTESSLALDNNYYVNTVEAAALVDGYLNISDLETNSEYALGVVAVDAEGNPSHATFYYFTPKLPEYPLVRATAEQYATAKPTYDYTVAWNDDYGRFDVTVNVTPAAGTVKYWVAVLGEEYLSSESVARDAVDYMLLKEGQYYGSKSFTEAATLVPDYKVGGTYDPNANVWITWLDEAGNYYECICEPIFKQTLVAKDNDAWKASQPTITANVANGVLSYTVTPGAGATNMYILPFGYTDYRDSITNTYMLTINPNAIQSATEYTGTLNEVQEDAFVMVAWTDAEGNLYEIKKSTDL